jgi:hypothetical protein
MRHKMVNMHMHGLNVHIKKLPLNMTTVSMSTPPEYDNFSSLSSLLSPLWHQLPQRKGFTDHLVEDACYSSEC